MHSARPLVAQAKFDNTIRSIRPGKYPVYYGSTRHPSEQCLLVLHSVQYARGSCSVSLRKALHTKGIVSKKYEEGLLLRFPERTGTSLILVGVCQADPPVQNTKHGR